MVARSWWRVTWARARASSSRYLGPSELTAGERPAFALRTRDTAPGVEALPETEDRFLERLRDLAAARLALQALLFRRIADEADLHERGGHLDAHQHYEGRLLHTARRRSAEARELLVREARELVRLLQMLGRDCPEHVPNLRFGKIPRRES